MDERDSSIVLLESPSGYFADLVKKGLVERKVYSFPLLETYLVNLLSHFLDTRNLYGEKYINESGTTAPQTLAETYLKAQNAELHVKYEMLKGLADRALYISGYFGDSLNRKLVDVDYYADMGGAAFGSLVYCTKEDTLAKVYGTLSEKFRDYVDVLTYISHHSFIKSDESLLRLYDRYLKTGSKLAQEKLIEAGVLPVSPGQVKLGNDN